MATECLEAAIFYCFRFRFCFHWSFLPFPLPLLLPLIFSLLLPLPLPLPLPYKVPLPGASASASASTTLPAGPVNQPPPVSLPHHCHCSGEPDCKSHSNHRRLTEFYDLWRENSIWVLHVLHKNRAQLNSVWIGYEAQNPIYLSKVRKEVTAKPNHGKRKKHTNAMNLTCIYASARFFFFSHGY